MNRGLNALLTYQVGFVSMEHLHEILSDASIKQLQLAALTITRRNGF